jgi:amino acid adenylation domain-containing protein
MIDRKDPSPEEKRRLLLRLLRERGAAAVAPLSQGQRGLWYLHQLATDCALYNEAWVGRIRFPLDDELLRGTLQALVDRHPILRTTYAEGADRPYQVVHAAMPVAFESTDATGWPLQRLQDRLHAEARRPFDLARGPVVRFHLFRLGPTDHVLLCVGHHIALDLWSTVLMMGELPAVYEALMAGGRPELPPPRATYRDFVTWQDRLLAGPDGERHWAYWRDRLAGDPPDLRLPTDRPRPQVQTFRGAAVGVALDADLTRRVKELARGCGSTLFVTLLAGLYALLYRYTDQDDIVIGTMSAGRLRPEFESVVGYFANMMPLRLDLSGRPSFRTLLARAGEAVLGGLEHQAYPFALLVRRLLANRDPGRPPLCSVLIQLNAHHVELNRDAEEAPGRLAQVRRAGATIEVLPLEQPIAKADLCLILHQSAGAIAGRLEYNTDLFDPATAGRMAGHWVNLLRSAVAEPDHEVAALPMLSDAERDLVVRRWNDTSSAYPRDRCVHQLFEEQAAAMPGAVAVTWDGRDLTYAELNHRANRLAHHLRALGVGPEVLVGVCLERSPDMLVAWLAVLKAGGAYLPLDPDYPPDRLEYLLGNSGAAILVTVQALADAVPGRRAKLVLLDADAGALAGRDATDPANRTAADGLAYVVYTSGSTGRPKGIEVVHRAITRLVRDTNYIRFEPADRVAQASNASFDLSTFEIWGALLNGARLVGLSKSLVLSPPDVAVQLRRQGVTVLILTTALFNQVARAAPSAFQTLRYLLFGGEKVEPQWVNAVLRAGPPANLLHVYGPTEITTLATAYRVTRPADGGETVPIGTPIGNTTTYILDEHRQPVAVGIPGELYLGGDGVARGYVNLPELTAERFLDDPFAGQRGARMYRTGDVARWRADGNIEFIGRRDFQVKLRGFRIELGEVEAVLGQHPHVAQAVAMVREDHPGDRRLVAYAVGKGAAALDRTELRRFLRSKLPVYMMPSALVVLDALPLTSNGKLDRAALPACGTERPDLAEAYVAPRTPLEQSLAAAWADVLRLDRVGVHDNFFELGGHSLLAVRLFSRLAESLGGRPPLAALFQAPTVARLADLLQRRQAAPSSPLVTLQTGGRRPFFCVTDVVGLAFVFVELARHLGADRPFHALQSRGLDGQAALTSVEAMAADFVEAVRAVQPEGPYLLGGYSMGGSVAYEMARQLRAASQDVALLALLDAACPAFVQDDRPRTADDWGRVARDMGLRLDGGVLERLLRMGADGLEPGDFERVLASGLAPPGVGVDELRPMLHVLRSNFQAFWQYRPQPQSCPIRLFRASEPTAEHPLGTDLGWGRLAPVDVQVIPGLHYTILREPHVEVIAGRLRDCLDAADPTNGAARVAARNGASESQQKANHER